jgi:hypothetical protein
MARVTPRQLESLAEIVSGMTGKTVIAYGAYGGWGVHLVHPDTSHTDLMGGTHPARECQRFLSGMLAGARLMAVRA